MRGKAGSLNSGCCRVIVCVCAACFHVYGQGVEDETWLRTFKEL